MLELVISRQIVTRCKPLVITNKYYVFYMVPKPIYSILNSQFGKNITYFTHSIVCLLKCSTFT